MNTSERMTDADLNAYVDGELDVATCAKLETWLDSHPEDAARVETYQRQNKELRKLFDPVMDELIPTKMLDLVENPSPKSKKPLWMQIAAAVVLLLAGGAGGWGLHGLQAVPQITPMPSYVERAVGAHIVYAAEVRHPVEVAANQEKHLVAWLSKRLGNPLRAPRLKSVGYQLVGGRLLEESGRPAAQFMYENSKGLRVTVYVRTYKGKDTAFKFFGNDEASAFYWIDSTFSYALAGNLPRPELMNIAHAIYEDLGT